LALFLTLLSFVSIHILGRHRVLLRYFFGILRVSGEFNRVAWTPFIWDCVNSNTAASTPTNRHRPASESAAAPQATNANGPAVAAGLGSARGAADARRSGIAAAVDLQEHAPLGARVERRRPRGRLSHGGVAAARSGIQLAKPTARRAKAISIRTATPSLRTSTPTLRFQKRRQPVISVDTKKKELVGDFKNGGQEWRPQGEPEPVRVHDFLDKQLGKAIPYGVYDVTNNQGWVNVGIDHDTATKVGSMWGSITTRPIFAAASIRRW